MMGVSQNHPMEWKNREQYQEGDHDMENVLAKERISFKNAFLNKIIESENIAISGHVRPDGDCIGSCLAVLNYIETNYNKDHKKHVDLYLDKISDSFSFLPGIDKVKNDRNTSLKYDLFISLDCGGLDRLGESESIFKEAKDTICIDHHVSNIGFAKINHIEPSASSTCEVLCSIFDEDKINLDIASALYTGIVHDTGVFKHSNTTRYTMERAGMLLSKGVDCAKIIDDSFYQKTYMQNQILGRCLMESMLVLDGKVIVSSIDRKQMQFYQAQAYDLEGVIDQLRITKGVEVAILIHETQLGEYKVSMRSNGDVNVSEIAVYFGGGGHVKAAGCTMNGNVYDVINNLTLPIEHQLKKLNVI